MLSGPVMVIFKIRNYPRVRFLLSSSLLSDLLLSSIFCPVSSFSGLFFHFLSCLFFSGLFSSTLFLSFLVFFLSCLVSLSLFLSVLSLFLSLCLCLRVVVCGVCVVWCAVSCGLCAVCCACWCGCCCCVVLCGGVWCVVWHAEKTSMCRFKTSPCVPAPRPHVSKHAGVVAVHTGTFLNLHTEVFWTDTR